ncbi:Avt7p KNAG_0A05380 [Huiozyma naganishii CBS 8797]|uniref:Amino acid transporter transmembrane domain-containing protein n=1 Tax=Huiozyma naganishii (strain ATCC MYA-139 / BCRC 22969 / CBS 8797 / KCTC 17520 / NBRC 10181 / NCYC 3082 / Yp74L-3) TaxID=1071383 RepID=J7RF62_HUIN7|nr:hypothetical protein KNAG_0A05380 [Kazachstania naganishii CBS 8797]CCK68203.1 hypothetical protein KNAG_0A05380 [Kazachstania naganishii CBS 8797]
MTAQSTATVGSSTINLVKTIIGAGLLAIPYAFAQDGILVGILLTLLAAVTSGFGLFALAKCSKTLIDPRRSSFFTLCMLTYPRLSPLFDFAMIVQCFGVGLSYLVLMGDIFPGLFGGDRQYWIVASAVIIGPLCSLKKLDHLKYSSVLGLFALAYLAVLVLSMFVKDVILTDNYKVVRGTILWFEIYSGKGLLSTFSIIIFAYVGAMNLFTIINELSDNNITNISKIINRSIAISTVAFLSVGITGYLTFGSNTLGNIILNYDPNSIWVNIGKFSLASMLLLSFPLLFHPLRIACNNLVVWFEINFNEAQPSSYYTSTFVNATNHSRTPIQLGDEEDQEGDNGEDAPLVSNRQPTADDVEIDDDLPGSIEQHSSFPDSRFYSITVGLLVVMYLIALRITSFALVLALVGATGSTSISFILPGLFGYKLIGSDSLAVGQMISPRDRFYKKCSLALVWFGFAVMILSLYVTMVYGA